MTHPPPLPGRLPTRQVRIGDLYIGSNHPVALQTMTTTDTMDTQATVDQILRCVQAGTQIIRITTPSVKEAEHLRYIQQSLRRQDCHVPLVADVHYTPKAALIAATIVQKIRINPGNYADKKQFIQYAYTDEDYAQEIERIAERFVPLVRLCKREGTAMRIGVNHGSLSDRIMSRYGDSPIGMVESALEFLRIARAQDYHAIVLSMKSSNPVVMVEAYRLLYAKMQEEFGLAYPLHLGVTEAGDGLDGRVKSALGIGTLLDEGLGDTIRVSLTEDPEHELPVCRALTQRTTISAHPTPCVFTQTYTKRQIQLRAQIGPPELPVVLAVATQEQYADLTTFWEQCGYTPTPSGYTKQECAADLCLLPQQPEHAPENVPLVIPFHRIRRKAEHIFPLLTWESLSPQLPEWRNTTTAFCQITTPQASESICAQLQAYATLDLVLLLHLSSAQNTRELSLWRQSLDKYDLRFPVIFVVESTHPDLYTTAIHSSCCLGQSLFDGWGNGLAIHNPAIGTQHCTQLSFAILQAARMRISKTEYISCPSCGRTLFDLQETTQQIRAATDHLKGVKIAIMGCIVNGPGEMADADFGYVGSGHGKIDLYKGKDIIKKHVPAHTAVDELITLIKENNRWTEKS